MNMSFLIKTVGILTIAVSICYIKFKSLSKTKCRQNHLQNQKQRYEKQIKIIGERANQTLLNSKCLVIGCGGLASGCIPLLAGSGIGTIGLVDDDLVDATNLHRQIIHSELTINQSKVESVKQFICNLNSTVSVLIFQERIQKVERLVELIQTHKFDCVVDCSDNAETRYLVNRACVQCKLPLIFGSAIGTSAQIGVFNAQSQSSPCYRCAFPNSLETCGTCTSEGVLGHIPVILGAMQAMEAMKVLTKGQVLQDNEQETQQVNLRPLEGRLLVMDLADMSRDAFFVMQVNKRTECPDCLS